MVVLGFNFISFQWVDFWPTDASTFDEHIVLSSESDGSERDDQEQIWYVGLGAFASDDGAFIRSGIKKKGKLFMTTIIDYLLAICVSFAKKI